MRPDPMGERRNAFHVFLFAVATLNGLLLGLGFPTSNAIDDQLPDIGSHVYGVVLLLGAGSVLVGMYWPAKVADGLLVKRLGYVALTVATFIYSVAVAAAQPGFRGFTAASITLAFSLICGWTVHRINVRIRTIIHLTEVGNGDE